MSKSNDTRERLIRVEERLINMSKSIEELTKRVNHEQSDYNKRLIVVEKFCTEDKARYEGRMQFFKWTSIVLGILVSGLTIAHFMGVF